MSKPPANAMPQAVHSLLLTFWPENLATAGVKTAVNLQMSHTHKFELEDLCKMRSIAIVLCEILRTSAIFEAIGLFIHKS